MNLRAFVPSWCDLETWMVSEALELESDRLWMLIENACVPFIGMDSEGVVTEWNRQAEQVFGWTRREAVGAALADLIIPEELRHVHRQGLKRFLRTGESRLLGRPIEMPAVRKDGLPLSMALTVTMWNREADRKPMFGAFLIDQTGRKRLEELLHEAGLEIGLLRLRSGLWGAVAALLVLAVQHVLHVAAGGR
jgi:PAS domain S-box-containing protein